MLTGLFMVQQTMALSVFAAGVVSSGVTGTANGKGGTTYNIDPTKTNGNTGFRQYSDFNLGANDIANLNFADINTFVNLVDKQIVINGIVNSMKNGGFYNGKAVFVSPNGMVVGASGVLNVGSLGVYTPTQGNYDSLVKNQTEAGLNSIMNSNGSADITINGKIISAGDVHLQGGQVDVAKGAGIIGGVNSASMSVLSSQEQANALFSNLVNTANLTNGSDFVSNGKGQIIIKSQNGTNIHGDIVNYAKGGEYTGPSSTNHSSIEILNYGTNGVNITGNIANAKGLVQLDNNRGDMNVGGNIKNDGTTQIYNNPFSAFTPVDPNTGLTISGNIDTKGQLNIRNKGGKGLNISGTINHDGNAYVQNGYLADEIGYDYQEQSKEKQHRCYEHYRHIQHYRQCNFLKYRTRC